MASSFPSLGNTSSHKNLAEQGKTVKPNTIILHSRADDVIPFEDSEELIRDSGLLWSSLIEIGSDHRLADPEPLKKMLEACERAKQ